MSRAREAALRLVRGTGVGELRRTRARVAELEDAVAETRVLDEHLTAEVERLEDVVADVAQAFLARR